MAHDVFISYASKDKPIADAICANLEGAGIRCWIAPRDIAPGDDWPTAISKAISQSQVMILVFSAHSNSSEDVGREIILAANNKLVIVPFKIENIEPEPGKQYYLARTHWLDAINPLTREQIEVLIKRIKGLVQERGGQIGSKDEIQYQSIQADATFFRRDPGPKKEAGRKRLFLAAGVITVFLIVLGGIVVGAVWNPGLTQQAITPTLAIGSESVDSSATGTGISEELVFSDSFEDLSYEGALDTTQWIFPPYYRFLTVIEQENGSLVFKRTTLTAEEDGQVQTKTSWSLEDFGYLEARLKIDSQHTGTDGNLNIGIVAGPVGSDGWYSTCGIGLGNPRPFLWCIQVTNGQYPYEYDRAFQALEYDRWYTVRIEINPRSGEIGYYLDGKLLDRWQPTDVKVMFDGQYFMVMGASALKNTAMTAYIDDVKIGK
ncbi:MAG: toll/interleukin-1 receptor domain-containing protein [Anaerolineales bacterium]|nr:toll/interleukin-1 receptor domain-containing protein [Anaerolineales bacterium]